MFFDIQRTIYVSACSFKISQLNNTEYLFFSPLPVNKIKYLLILKKLFQFLISSELCKETIRAMLLCSIRVKLHSS